MQSSLSPGDSDTQNFGYICDMYQRIKMKLNKSLFLGLIMVFTILPVLSLQGETKDTLAAILSSDKNDTCKIESILDYAGELAWTDVTKAVEYTRQALVMSEKITYTKGIAYAKFRLSGLCGDYDFELSESLLLQSLGHAKAIDDSMLMAGIYCSLGNLKSNFNFLEEARNYFHKSLGIFLRHKQDSCTALIYNNLGVLHDLMYPDCLSNDHYLKASEINTRTQNHQWLAMNYLNIGINFTEMGEYDEGSRYLQQSRQIAKKHAFIRLYPWVYNSLSYYYFIINDYQSSIRLADTALTFAREQSNLLQERDALKHMSEGYFEVLDIENAHHYLKQYGAVKDTINKCNRLKKIDMTELKNNCDKESKQQELKHALLANKLRQKELTSVIIILIAGLLIFSLLFIYVFQKYKMHRKSLEQKNTMLEIEALTRDIEYRNKELTTNVMYLLKKNEFISSISNKLKLATGDSHNNYNRAIESIIGELDKSVAELNWEDFEVRFQKVHVGFYNKLSTKYPLLTPNDLRLCAFLKLNMTSKEITGITFQSTESLKTARYRLRKKLSLERQDNLVAFLTKF